MKLFIATDLEGISGIVSEEQTFSTGKEYEKARSLMAKDVNSAIEGALLAEEESGGSERIDQILVNDGHGRGYNIFIDELHPRAELFSGEFRSLSLMTGLDSSFDLVFLIGFHAKSGSEGLLNHTMSSRTISRVWVNGKEVGEIFLASAVAGEFNVPVGLVTGDKVAIQEAKELLGEIETVVVKESISRQSASCLPLEEAYTRIRAAAKQAIKRRKEFKPLKITPPIELKIEYILTQHAERQTLIPGVIRVDSRTLIYRANSVIEAFQLFYF